MNVRGSAARFTLLITMTAHPAYVWCQDEEPKLNQPTRPGTMRSAEIQRHGVLQLDLGGNVRVNASEFRNEQSLPLTIRYSFLDSLVVETQVEPFISEQKDIDGLRRTGVGDTVVGAQWLAANEERRRPSVAAAYYVKVPTAPSSKELGTGRVDHHLVLLLSKKFGETDADINVAYLNTGREQGDRVSGMMAGVSLSREFQSHFGFVGELSELTQDMDVPHGAYALGAVTYRLTERMRLDGGTRVGLTHDAARFSVIGGISVSVPVH